MILNLSLDRFYLLVYQYFAGWKVIFYSVLDDVEVNDLINTVCEFSDVDHSQVCIGSDLDDLVIKESSDLWHNLLLDQQHSSIVRSCNLDDGSGCQLSDGLILLVEALHELDVDIRRIKSKV